MRAIILTLAYLATSGALAVLAVALVAWLVRDIRRGRARKARTIRLRPGSRRDGGVI